MLNIIKNKLKPKVKSLVKKLKGSNENVRLHGMTNISEQQYFEIYAREQYQGIGEIVDLGSWMGSTTIPLAKGIKNNKNCQNKIDKIHAFDRFIWESWMNISSQDTLKQYQPGDSFLDEFKKRTKKYSKYIKVYPGDLCEIGWIGKEIEFLLVDAMKSWKLTSSICQDFFPFLIPGKSLVLHQDFSHFYTPWIHLVMYRFRDYFEPHYDVPNSPSFVFKYTSKIPADKLDMDYSFKSFSVEEAEAAVSYSLSCTPQEKHNGIIAAKIMFFAHQKQYDQAQKEVDKYIKQGYQLEKDLKKASEFIKNKVNS
ncbi:MAG TPA: hypothetical protein DCF68_11640 [Cyanothece sp. UBA12306]|nr:hypothetical protein [Cyanothece sp. UBA12306]